MHRKLFGMVLAFTMVAVAGCGSKIASKSFIRENTNLSLIQRVAVLPFEGGGRAPRIRELAMTQILETDMFDVVDKGRVDVFLQQEAIAPGAPLDAFTIRRLGENLEVEAVLLGSVEQSTESRGAANFMEIIMTLRLVDCETGQLLWQASGRGSGYSLADRLFGFSPKDSFEVTMDLLSGLITTMHDSEG